MNLGHDILYLSNADIEACGLSLAEVEGEVEAVFAAKNSPARVRERLRMSTSMGLGAATHYQSDCNACRLQRAECESIGAS